MAKFYGPIGYSITEEVDPINSPGCWADTITERYYYGEVIRLGRQLVRSDNLNDNVDINNQISIIADPFACDHMFAMRYVKWMGAAWKITNVEVRSPRLILTIGGLWNGDEAE